MIIGISGKMGVGKSLMAMNLQDMLVRGHVSGEGVPVIRAYADPLKQECAETYEVELERFYSQQGKRSRGKCGRTLREILQAHGMLRRGEDRDYWLKAFAQYIAQDLRYGNDVLVPDVRFPNEARDVLSRGGFLVRLDPFPTWQEGPNGQHESETALDDFAGFHLVIRPGLGMAAAVMAARDVLKRARV